MELRICIQPRAQQGKHKITINQIINNTPTHTHTQRRTYIRHNFHYDIAPFASFLAMVKQTNQYIRTNFISIACELLIFAPFHVSSSFVLRHGERLETPTYM